MIIWVKYGFETTPEKMYNTDCSSAVLLSFLKATCIKDIDEYCKQRNIQLSIEIDAIRRSGLPRKSIVNTLSTERSRPGTSSAVAAAGDGPTDDPSGSAPTTVRRNSNTGMEAAEEAEKMAAKKAALERQMDVITDAAKIVKELIAGTTWLDLVDQQGNRMRLDEAGNNRVDTLVIARQHYNVVAVYKDELEEIKTTPLVFKLHG